MIHSNELPSPQVRIADSKARSKIGDTIRHISISGDLGSGKSSVAQKVASVLGVEVLSTGAIHREIAAEMRLSTLETNLLAEENRDIDTRIDTVSAELGSSSPVPIVFDSRMAWHMVPSSLKVRLLVDPDVSASRIVSRAGDAVEEYESLSDARHRIRERYRSEVRRFQARYGVDITDLNNFDLVIDTSDCTIEDAANLVFDRYTTPSSRLSPEVLVSPKRLLPAFGYGEDYRPSAEDEALAVVYERPFFYALHGQAELEASLLQNRSLVHVQLLSGSERLADMMGRIDRNLLTSWEDAHSLSFAGFQNWIT